MSTRQPARKVARRTSVKPTRPTRPTKPRTAPKVARKANASATARRRAVPKPGLAGPPPLTWTQSGPRMRSARAKGGAYVLVSHDGVDWSADWRPPNGRPTSVLFRQPLGACVTACERDHVVRFTNEVLARSGSEALAAPDLQGDAVAWKRRR